MNIKDTNKNKDDKLQSILVIGGSAGCALVLITMLAFCILRQCKSCASETSTDANADLNPVYGNYSEVENDSEITDTNANYAAPDLEEIVCTRVTDLNSAYGI